MPPITPRPSADGGVSVAACLPVRQPPARRYPSLPGGSRPNSRRSTLSRHILQAVLLCVGVLVTPVVHAHVHVEVVYRNGQLRLVCYDFEEGESDPANVVLPVGLPAASPIPNLPAFTNLLGEAGATTWVLPQSHHPDLLWLGIGNASLSASDFTGSLSLRLLAVEGPGHFALFFNDAFGRPIPRMNSRDGINAEDALPLPFGSHLHCNWAFSAPGRYLLTFQVSGTLRAGNTPIASAPTDYCFAVEAPPRSALRLTQTAANTFQLQLQAHPGLHYAIETTTNLVSWTKLTNVVATTPVTSHPLDVSPWTNRFFRARLR